MTLLSAYRLHLPPELSFESVRAFIRSLSGIAGLRPPALGWRPHVVLEAHLSRDAAAFFLLAPQLVAEAVTEQIAACLPDVIIEEADLPVIEVDRTVELRLTRTDRALRTDEPANLASALLAGLVPQEGSTIWQVVLLPLPYRDRLREATTHHEAEDAVGQLLSPEVLVGRSDIRRKQAEPPFSVSLRFGCSGPSARVSIGRAISSLRSVSSAGVTVVPRAIGPRTTSRRLRARRPSQWSWPAVLNAEELAILCGWPTNGTRVPWSRGPARLLMAAPTALPRAGRVFGTSVAPLPPRTIATDERAIRHHTHVLGPTGVGKSTLLARLALEDVAAQRATVVIDPKGDLVEAILDRIPRPNADVVVIDPTDDARPIGLNLLEGVAHVPPEVTVELVLSLLHRLYARSWGPRTQDILHASLMTLASAPGATLVDLPLLLTRPDYRRRLVAAIDDPLGVGSFWEWYDALSSAEQAQVLGLS